MIYVAAPLVIFLDALSLYYGTKVVRKIQASSMDRLTFTGVLGNVLYLSLLRLLWRTRLSKIDEEQLATYKRNQPLIRQVIFAGFVSVGVVLGFLSAFVSVLLNRDLYSNGSQDVALILFVALSALAAASSGFVYLNTKSFVQRYRSHLLLNFDSIAGDANAGAPSDARDEGADAAPEKGRKMGSTSLELKPLYWGLAFRDDEKAKRALRIYRMERHGQYQYLGLPEPNTIVVHRQDLSAFVDRLIDEGLTADNDFEYKPVFLAGQLSVEERSRLRRPGLQPQSKLNDPIELDRRLIEARERLAAMKGR
jgi:hypothetical protein